MLAIIIMFLLVNHCSSLREGRKTDRGTFQANEVIKSTDKQREGTVMESYDTRQGGGR